MRKTTLQSAIGVTDGGVLALSNGRAVVRIECADVSTHTEPAAYRWSVRGDVPLHLKPDPRAFTDDPRKALALAVECLAEYNKG